MARQITITHGNVTPNAKESFEYDSNSLMYDSLERLKQYNAGTTNYADPTSKYQTILDGNAKLLPDNRTDESVGLLSILQTNASGTFTSPVTLTFESGKIYGSNGFTFTFDKYNDIYCTNLKIQWYLVTSEAIELVEETEFQPNSAMYFCDHPVATFNRVVISFYSLNMPNNRLRVETIDFGYGQVFKASEITNIDLIQQMEPTNDQLYSCTCDFGLILTNGMTYQIQKNQPITVNVDGEDLITTVITDYKKKSNRSYDLQTSDYISVMDNIIFTGGIYDEITAGELLEQVFINMNIPYSVDEEIAAKKLSGYIPYTTVREALRHILFATIAYANTLNCNGIEIKKLKDDVTQKIELNQIMQGQTIEALSNSTTVALTAHSYSKKSKRQFEIYTAEKVPEDSAELLVAFEEPMFDVKIGHINKSDEYEIYFSEDSSYGVIKEVTPTYAIIEVKKKECSLIGCKYTHSTSVKTKTVSGLTENDATATTEITDATLISLDNVDEVLEHCFDKLTVQEKLSCKIVERDAAERFELGDKISVATEFDGYYDKTVTKQQFSLKGSRMVKEVELQ